ncbi:hypothetical protein GCM10009640_19640 [Agrococcus citreus]|uniref:Uncharacterized protein n=1 Tax=Agrococcus citreus TaxID=84643 RepID=A0ABN1YW92_9MICO
MLGIGGTGLRVREPSTRDPVPGPVADPDRSLLRLTHKPVRMPHARSAGWVTMRG